MAVKRDVLQQRLREFWDGQEAYWETTAAEEPTLLRNRGRAASFLPNGATVLDAACGNSANARLLAGRCRYFGVDLSLTGLRSAVRPGLHLACGDTHRLPFCDASFDVAIATYVLEHSVAPRQMLREMLRVVRPSGRLILLGPAWDLPFWYPNSLLSRAHSCSWWLRYTLERVSRQMAGWWFGLLPFQIIDHPDALDREFIYDADAVYIVWTYEVIRQMRRWGCRLVHWEVDDRLLGANAAVRWLKRIIMLLPPYRRAGSTTLLVFES